MHRSWVRTDFKYSLTPRPNRHSVSAGGDLNPILGFYFPLFSMVFPWGISIRVETCGSERKQNCGNLWSIYVQSFYVF